MKSVDGRLVACGTNGTQLIRISVEAAFEIPDVIIPCAACAVIAKLDGCTVRVSDKAIEARTDTCCFAHRLIDGVLPAYERVIPALTGNSVEANRSELITALKRMLFVATHEKDVVPAAGLESGDDELSLNFRRQPDAAADVLPAITSGSGGHSLACSIRSRLNGSCWTLLTRLQRFE